VADDSKFVNGAAKLSQRIATITAKLALPLMTQQIGSLLERRIKERFDKEITADGKAWKALKESTLKRKAYLGYGDKKKLVRDSSLRNAIKAIKGGEGSYAVNTGAGVRIGVDAKAIDRDGDPVSVYARIQNRERNQRQFIGIGRLDIKSVDSLLRRAGDDAVGG
jgi:hypothetical protein